MDNDPFFAARASVRSLQRETAPCAGGCGKKIPEVLRSAYCPTCWNVRRILEREAVADLRELAARCHSREQFLARTADLIRRSGVDDADTLLQELERRVK